RARILGPVFGHPAGDGPLVTLHRAAGRALQAVVQPVVQQLPGVPGMVADPGELLDHGRDARQGPVVVVEAVRAGALPERLVDQVRGLVGRAGGGPGGAVGGGGGTGAGACPVGPALRSASSPPACQRPCQRLTFCRATPSWRATSAWVRPAGPHAPRGRGRAPPARLLASGRASG